MLVDVVPLLALVVLLAVAYTHPRGRTEAAAGVLAVAATLATGALSAGAVRTELRQLGPVVCFLVAILVVAQSCRDDGVFAALGARLDRVRSQQRLLLLTFAAAAVVTVVLSLDATVVLLTPVVLAATAKRSLPGQLACVRLANSASLLVPVANLTNLLALPHLHLTFARFAFLMAPSWLVVLLIEYVVLRTRYRADLSGPLPATTGPVPRIPLTTMAVVVLMLLGFVATSPLHLAPAWIAGAAALILTARDLVNHRTTPRAVRDAAHPGFAIYVLCLGIVVAALGAGWFGDRVAGLVPSGRGLGMLLLVATLGAVLANLVNNLPATLLLVPLVAPLGTTALLALLIGVNVGSSMTWTGSLANLLWRRTLVASGAPVPSRDFHLTALLAGPAGIVAAVVVLDAWQGLVG